MFYGVTVFFFPSEHCVSISFVSIGLLSLYDLKMKVINVIEGENLVFHIVLTLLENRNKNLINEIKITDSTCFVVAN